MSWAKAAASAGIAHGVAAEFDDHGLPVVALHVRQGLGQDARLQVRRRRRRRLACGRCLVAALPSASSLCQAEARARARHGALASTYTGLPAGSTEFAHNCRLRLHNFLPPAGVSSLRRLSG